jgi:hypothetical protein
MGLTKDLGSIPRAITVDSINRVGIGTPTPDERLHVSGGRIKTSVATTGAAYLLTSNNNGSTIYGTDGIGGYILTDWNAPILFYTNNTERMRIFSNGNVLIQDGGTFTNGGYRLDVNGTGRFSGALDANSAASAANGSININNTDPTLRFRVSGGTTNNRIYEWRAIAAGSTNDRMELRLWNDAQSSASHLMSITSSGDVGIGTTSPSSGISSVDTTLQIENGNVAALALNNTASRKYTIYSGVGGQLGFFDATAGTERMRITSDGYVGVGTGSTDVNNGDLIGVLAFRSNDASVNSSGAIGSIRSYATASFNTGSVSGDLRFYTQDTGTPNGSLLSGAERMRITSGGSVGIGTTSPTGGRLHIGDSGADNTGLYINNNTFGHFFTKFAYQGSVVGSISYNGSNTVYTTTSDYRLKQDLKSFNGLDLISKIKVYDYEWKSDNSRMNGVLAHELQEVVPYAVVGEKDAEQMQGVDYSKLVPILVKAIQELTARLEILENK